MKLRIFVPLLQTFVIIVLAHSNFTLHSENVRYEKRWEEQENIIHQFQMTGLTGEETVKCCLEKLNFNTSL